MEQLSDLSLGLALAMRLSRGNRIRPRSCDLDRLLPKAELSRALAVLLAESPLEENADQEITRKNAHS